MRPNYDDIHRLVLKMREGSKDARRELIEAHVGLAFKVAKDFEDDEALSDALFTLVQEVDAFRHTDKHPAALPSYLKSALGRAANLHARDVGHRPKQGPPMPHCASSDAARFLHSGRSLSGYDGFSAIDLMDQLLAACETEEERKMIFWKSHNMTYEQVALKVGCSTTHVARSMSRLALRFGVQERLGA